MVIAVSIVKSRFANLLRSKRRQRYRLPRGRIDLHLHLHRLFDGVPGLLPADCVLLRQPPAFACRPGE